MKQILSGVAMGALLVMFPISSYAMPYSDLPKANPNYKAINEFTNQGILEGYSDGTFKPNQPINRAEALKIILKAFNKDAKDLEDVKFPDVAADDWFYTYVQQGLKHGIIQGFDDGTFKPGNQVLLSESLKMGLEAWGVDIDEVEYGEFHPSVTLDHWFAKYFVYGYQKNFISLDKNGGLNPIRPMNRGEFVELIYRIQSTDDSKPDANFDITYNWQNDTNNQGLAFDYPLDWTYYSLGEGVFLGFFGDQKPSVIKSIPNGARITINFLDNPDKISFKEYTSILKDDFDTKYSSRDIQYKNVKTNFGEGLQIFIEEQGLFDFYIYLENNKILFAESSFDTTSLKAMDLIKDIQGIYDRLIYDPSLTLSASQKIEEARKNVYVSGKGLKTLDLFITKDLFKTDSIGFGTGPVDYYYIPGADSTIVYNRTTDAILGVLDGKTDIFKP